MASLRERHIRNLRDVALVLERWRKGHARVGSGDRAAMARLLREASTYLEEEGAAFARFVVDTDEFDV